MRIRRHLHGLGQGTSVEPALKPIVENPEAATPAEKKKAPPRCIEMKTVERAREELKLTALPEVTRKFGEFMVEQSKKELTPRDIVKAYTITRSSVQRAGRTAEALRASWPDHPFTGNDIRPEDAFAFMLRTEDGQTYLNEAMTGNLTDAGRAAARRITNRFKAFSMDQTLYNEMVTHAPVLAGKTKKLVKVLRSGTKAEWSKFTEEHIYGISHAKKGFILALLGRGDIPTADAREIECWWDNRACYKKHQLEKAKPQFVKRLEQRLKALNLETPEHLRPFYQHLAHHAVWDAVGNSSTTHDDVVACMRLAGVPKRPVRSGSLY